MDYREEAVECVKGNVLQAMSSRCISKYMLSIMGMWLEVRTEK